MIKFQRMIWISASNLTLKSILTWPQMTPNKISTATFRWTPKSILPNSIHSIQSLRFQTMSITQKLARSMALLLNQAILSRQSSPDSILMSRTLCSRFRQSSPDNHTATASHFRPTSLLTRRPPLIPMILQLINTFQNFLRVRTSYLWLLPLAAPQAYLSILD